MSLPFQTPPKGDQRNLYRTGRLNLLQAMDEYRRAFETRSVTSSEKIPRAQHAHDVTVPVHLSSTYEVDGLDPDTTLDDLDPDRGEYLYSRLANPTRNKLEHRFATLEGGDHGFAFASGSAAIVATLMAVVEPGDHIVTSEDLYGGTKSMLSRLFADRLDVEMSYVDARNSDAIAEAIRPKTTMLWIESPTNPLMRLCDIGTVAAIADEYDVRLGVDNTFVSPYFQRPLNLGADVVIHSTTKYLNGHSDSIGGAVVTDDDALADEIGFLQQVGMGSMLAPFDSYLVLRGLKTLPLRMNRHEANAIAVAEHLSDHDHVVAVHYPGLESHPQHDLATSQMSGYGGVLSFELEANLDEVETFVAALREMPLAVSLGGVESLIEHPASMTHSPLSQAERDELGITNSLLRVSVGVEHVDDLLTDFDRGFAALR